MNNNKNHYFDHNHFHNVDRSRNQENRCAHTFHHNHDKHVCESKPCRPRFHGAPNGFDSGLHVNKPCRRPGCGHPAYAGFDHGCGMHRPMGRPDHFHGCGRPDFNRCAPNAFHGSGRYEFGGRPACGRPMSRPAFHDRPGCGRPAYAGFDHGCGMHRPMGRPDHFHGCCKPFRMPFYPTEFRKTDDGLVIETKLAGFAPENLKTAVEGERLTVTATRQTGRGEETFCCKYPLRGISRDAVTASLKDGLLTLILPFIKADEKSDMTSDNAQPAVE